MRLGNLDVFCNAVREEKERWSPESTHGIMWAAILELVEVCPTVDQEELPIVLELEEKVRELQDQLHYLDFWVEQKEHVEESARQDQAALKVMRKRYEITVGELRTALSKAVAEKEAAEALLAEYSGIDGCKIIETCFGYPLDEVQRLVEADKAAKLQRATKGDDSIESAQKASGERLP